LLRDARRLHHPAPAGCGDAGIWRARHRCGDRRRGGVCPGDPDHAGRPAMKILSAASLFACLLLSGCTGDSGEDHQQSVLEPAGPGSSSIADLWWLLFWVCTIVFVIVLILTGWAISRRANAEL